MNPHCEPGRPPIRHSDRLLRIKRGNLPTFGKPSSQRQAEEVLLRRIKCYLMTELDNQDQTHLKIYVSLAMPTALNDLSKDIPFHIDDQRHTLCVSNLSGTGLPEENNWLATVYRGTRATGVVAASVSLGCS